MEIPVCGMDPSFRNWGIAEAVLDLETGILSTPKFTLIQPKEEKSKQVRKNSKDLEVAELLATQVLPIAQRAKVVFVEVPHGSQSARAMASYGVCIGILGSIKAQGIPLIEVSAAENKIGFTGIANATKDQMIQMAIDTYPDAPFLLDRKGNLIDKNEHLADAIATIHAGVNTSVFQNLMRLFSKV